MLSGTLLLNTISRQFSHDGSKRQISGLPPSEGGFIDSRNIQKKGNSTNIIAKKIAEIYNLPIEEIAKQTTRNAKSVFKI